MARGYLLYVLFILTLVSVCEAIADCQESEYEDERGSCVPCAQCGPGEELSEECGSARDIRCVPCRPGRYKEDRGYQRCLRCLPCAVINRIMKANCTPTTNSVCGDCLPGFYSKTRIGGLQELECFPCTAHTPRTETQCHPRPGFGQPSSTEPPPARDPVILVAIIIVALALILVTLVTFSVICCGRFFKSQCQRAFQRSHAIAGQAGRIARQLESTSSPREEQPIPPYCFGSVDTSRQIDGSTAVTPMISDIAVPSACQSPAALLTPSVELCAIPPPPVKPLYTRSISETQPLIRNSGCSDCFSGCGPSAEFSQAPAELEGSQTHSCASEKQHWSHIPVECTELDLQNFSSDDGFSCTCASHDRIEASQGSRVVLKAHRCSQCGTKTRKEAKSSCCRNLSCEFQNNEERVSCLNRTALALPVSQMPESLVALLALKLDKARPGQKDFRDVAFALGVQPCDIEHMPGFQALHNHLSSSCTLLHLIQTLHRLHQRDCITLICSHFGQQCGYVA
ncbi:tumor necrosis factor receptor superfamily member 27 [Gastrophryne carolinensis]